MHELPNIHPSVSACKERQWGESVRVGPIHSKFVLGPAGCQFRQRMSGGVKLAFEGGGGELGLDLSLKLRHLVSVCKLVGEYLRSSIGRRFGLNFRWLNCRDLDQLVCLKKCDPIFIEDTSRTPMR
ncbi:hypothetical protein DVH05_024454 [Phytophthora capsici]|nr:hypothetical protein DVH05_024454 [Phytophthora capsici]